MRHNFHGRKIRRRAALILVLVLICLPGSPAWSLDSSAVLRLASVDNIPPYIYREDGKLVGLSIDIINELASRGSFKIAIETYPWARVLLLLEEGAIDGAFSAYRTQEREEKFLYTGIIHYDELRIAVKKGHEFDYKDIKSLYGKKLGKGRGVYVSKEFSHAVDMGDITLAETDDMRMTNIKKLHEGRLDAVIGSPVAMRDYANKLGYRDIIILPHEVKEAIPAYLVLSKKSNLAEKTKWRKKLTRILNEMHSDGTIADINKLYGVEGR